MLGISGKRIFREPIREETRATLRLDANAQRLQRGCLRRSSVKVMRRCGSTPIHAFASVHTEAPDYSGGHSNTLLGPNLV